MRNGVVGRMMRRVARLVSRWLLGILVGVGSVLLIAVSSGFVHDRLSLATPALLLVLPVLLAAVLGGRWPSIVVAVLLEVDRQRSALLRAVSHDLRTPLVTISGVSSDLRSGEFFDESTRNDLLDVIVAAATFGGRIAGAMTAGAACLSFNFFHSQPLYTLRVRSSEDIWTIALLFVIGLVVGQLAVFARTNQARAIIERAGITHLEEVGALVAADQSPSAVWDAVQAALLDE